MREQKDQISFVIIWYIYIYSLHTISTIYIYFVRHTIGNQIKWQNDSDQRSRMRCTSARGKLMNSRGQKITNKYISERSVAYIWLNGKVQDRTEKSSTVDWSPIETENKAPMWALSGESRLTIYFAVCVCVYVMSRPRRRVLTQPHIYCASSAECLSNEYTVWTLYIIVYIYGDPPHTHASGTTHTHTHEICNNWWNTTWARFIIYKVFFSNRGSFTVFRVQRDIWQGISIYY